MKSYGKVEIKVDETEENKGSSKPITHKSFVAISVCTYKASSHKQENTKIMS